LCTGAIFHIPVTVWLTPSRGTPTVIAPFSRELHARGENRAMGGRPRELVMSTKMQQRYIVHLDIQATAVDPSDAVAAALAQVRRGAMRTFDFHVEEVHEAARRLAGGFDDGADRGPYSGEFLG
jgi:hypothetical protein